MQCQECSTETTGEICPKCGATIEGTPKWYAEGIAYLGEQKQFALAHELLEEGLQAHPTSVLLWYNGGVLEEQMSNRDGAVRCYQEVIKLRPANEKAYQALERLLGRPMPRPTAAPPPPAAPMMAPPPAPAPMMAPPSAAPVAAATPALAKRQDTPVAEATHEAPETDMPAAPALDLQALPPLSESRAAIEEKSKQWAAIARIAGIVFIVSFIALIAFLNMKNLPLFVTALLLFICSALLFFAARTMTVAPGRRR